MDTIVEFLVFVAVILIVSFVGAYLPMTTRATDKQMHLMIAFSTGVFLGILFLILFPEAVRESDAYGIDIMTVMYVALAGFLLMFTVDFLMKHYKKAECDCDDCLDHHSHSVTSLSAFFGLSIHAALDGLALATAFTLDASVGVVILLALSIHKAAEVFSLSSTFLLAGGRKRSMTYMTVFCLITPIAALVSYLLLGGAESNITGPAFAFSAGVFMFVTMLHMIPEAFHRKDIKISSLLLMLIGLLIILCVVILMGNSGL
ncbi:zinc transporter ZupT [Candidatus Methanoplasma termitum]|uniref:ZupT protein n=1 Tax=Candidatus Methanoplasma termitum TaxID=1577791 RepID=A0A0A7LGQ7_9ARCH|nr:ZIP family metal transporter [Candidatus Methanoplasma termitum]AIZ56671.1 zinc transporter ZupT [Candidatus Methanoplasma termitum]MCL2333315.1 ZIP family metal transporter [Candidatus Methanoplasma sp.]